jgi:hypothetical protein
MCGRATAASRLANIKCLGSKEERRSFAASRTS